MSNDPSIRRLIQNVETPPEALHPSQRPHDVDSSHAFLRAYHRLRIEKQFNYYQDRIREYDANSGFMVAVAAGIMATSSFVSAIGAGMSSPVLALATAILPAFAALIAALRQLYQWEKQAALYRDASFGLQSALLLLPDDDVYDRREARAILPSLVQQAEDVFYSEINQWGQINLGMDNESAKDKLNEALEELSRQDRLDSPNNATFREGGLG